MTAGLGLMGLFCKKKKKSYRCTFPVKLYCFSQLAPSYCRGFYYCPVTHSLCFICTSSSQGRLNNWGFLWNSGSKQHHSPVVAMENSTSCVYSRDSDGRVGWDRKRCWGGFDNITPHAIVNFNSPSRKLILQCRTDAEFFLEELITQLNNGCHREVSWTSSSEAVQMQLTCFILLDTDKQMRP